MNYIVKKANISYPYQSMNMDIDKNGAIEEHDSYFLVRVNFGLLRFITLSVFPATSCNNFTSLIFIRALQKGDIYANTNQTTIYIDVESKNNILSLQLNAARLIQGTVAVANKNGAFNGRVFKMEAQSDGVFTIAMQNAPNSHNIGLSVFQATTDFYGVSITARNVPMFGYSAAPLFQSALNLGK